MIWGWGLVVVTVVGVVGFGCGGTLTRGGKKRRGCNGGEGVGAGGGCGCGGGGGIGGGLTKRIVMW